MAHIISVMVLVLRCVKGDKTGFSYSDDLNLNAIQGAIDFAKGISNNPQGKNSNRSQE